MPPAFQPGMNPNSPYRANRSPAITPAAVHQQAAYSGYNYGQQQFPPVRISSSSTSSLSPASEPCKPAPRQRASRMRFSSQSCLAVPISTHFEHQMSRDPSPSCLVFGPVDPLSSSRYNNEQFLTEMRQLQAMYAPQPGGLDPYTQFYGQNYPPQGYGMTQSMHYPGVPASPGRGHSFPHQAYPVPGYGQPPQAQGMSRTPSNMSERPPSAAQQPSTPAMTNVSHVSQTPNAPSGSPVPGSSFSIPSKTKSKAIVVGALLTIVNSLSLTRAQIKTADGKVVDFKSNEKPASPAQPPPAPKSPAIVATPTPPPRPESTHSRTESVAAKTDTEKKAEFLKQFQENLQAKNQQEEAEKKKAEAEKAEAERAQKAQEEAEAKAKEEAEKAAKEKEAAEAAKAEEEERKRKEDEEFERM